MEETLTLTPEQLFFLGTLMDAEHINYDYIAALGEIQRNYSRSYRKCLDDLTRLGLLRQRLSGEVSLRPIPKKLLEPLFFGEKEWVFEIFTLGKEETRQILRFHQQEDSVTRVQAENNRLILSQSSPEELEQLATELAGSTEHPAPAHCIQKGSVTRVITAKQAVMGIGSTATVLFTQFGGLYTTDETGTVVAVPASQAKHLLLSPLKGE